MNDNERCETLAKETPGPVSDQPVGVRGFSEGQCPNCPKLSRTLLRLHRVLRTTLRRYVYSVLSSLRP